MAQLKEHRTTATRSAIIINVGSVGVGAPPFEPRLLADRTALSIRA